MEQILKKYPLLKDRNVSRETFAEFERFISMLQNIKQEINIISKKTAKNEVIRQRHIEDSSQIIEFVDLNHSIITDIGSGGGMPGIIISIMLKNLKNSSKLHLYEKSHHKSAFLRKVSRELNLNTEVIQENIFEAQNLESGTIMARAFKPLPIVLDLVYKNFSSYKNLILFMGKNGEKILEETLKDWDFDFEKQKSITSKDSFLLNIKNIKKKIKCKLFL
jgi:16S rRNA (guanine527-N7)-methyltransferase